MVRFIPRYVIVFGTIVIFLTSLFVTSLLAHRNGTDLSVWILYPMTLLNRKPRNGPTTIWSANL